jgi:hypothetical protein
MSLQVPSQLIDYLRGEIRGSLMHGLYFGSSWNRVGRIGVSGREHARARERQV